jgi:hypothetical protein
VVGTYPKCHAQMLTKVPKIPPKYPKSHAQMLAKVPKMLTKVPKIVFDLSLLRARGWAVEHRHKLTPYAGMTLKVGLYKLRIQLTHSG